MMWGMVGLVLVLVLGTKSFVAEASLGKTNSNISCMEPKATERKTIVVTPEQYKLIKNLNFYKNR